MSTKWQRQQEISELLGDSSPKIFWQLYSYTAFIYSFMNTYMIKEELDGQYKRRLLYSKEYDSSRCYSSQEQDKLEKNCSKDGLLEREDVVIVAGALSQVSHTVQWVAVDLIKSVVACAFVIYLLKCLLTYRKLCVCQRWRSRPQVNCVTILLSETWK